jgi:hypothetical protein
VDNLAARIEWAYRHPAELREVMARGREIYLRNNWDAEEKRLINLVDGLIGRR